MPLEERKERWVTMNDQVVRNDVTHWCERFLSALHKTRVMTAAAVEESLGRPAGKATRTGRSGQSAERALAEMGAGGSGA
jgi:trehalose-6-phosphate synthase